MRTPERAVWPLPPRPPVLPLPEPMPRPTRVRSLTAPGLSRIPFSFMASSSPTAQGLVLDDHEVLHPFDHAAHLRSVGQGPAAVDLVQPKPDQGLALVGLGADGGADLPDGHGVVGHHALRVTP